MQYHPAPNIHLYCGDVRDYRGAITPCRAAITDPPYPMQSGGNSGTHFKGGKLKAYDNKGEVVKCTMTWAEIMEVLHAWTADRSDTFVMASDSLENPQKAHHAAKEAGFRYHKTWFWDKGAPTPSRWGMTHIEHILYLYRGKARSINNPSQKQVLKFRRCRDSSHPTPKPVPLMRALVRCVGGVGDMVVDPFMGSGASAMAAVLEGRGFTGFELEEAYFREACARVDRALKLRDLLQGMEAAG